MTLGGMAVWQSNSHSDDNGSARSFMPAKRRLSAKAWEVTWLIKLELPIQNPENLHQSVSKLNSDILNVRSQLRTRHNVLITVTTLKPDMELFDESLKVFVTIEKKYGVISKIENRPADFWGL